MESSNHFVDREPTAAECCVNASHNYVNLLGRLEHFATKMFQICVRKLAQDYPKRSSLLNVQDIKMLTN